ncbi:MAG TPA: T9SS type A sorting domain-containing protein [Candidatus Kapabacteria bacterium]|nr:T9SS type A sorting domain-containing protein [Candidatus Kapabacteria bacterium]
MRINTIRIAFFLLLSTALTVPAAKAQHPVLFETFTNSCDPSGSAADAIRNAFDASVNSVVANEASKIIHLDHHIQNQCDGLQNTYSTLTAEHVLPPGNQEFGAVDRTVFSSTSTRGSTSESEWTSVIEAQAQLPPAATMQLVTATLDKNSSQLYVLHVKVNVTLTQSIPDSLIIRYAIVQDGCQDNLDGSTSKVTLNDVVREITYVNTSPYVVVAGHGDAGTQKIMSWDPSLTGPTSINAKVPWDYTKIRLVAFLESTSGGNFQVVNAAVLRQDLDTLQAPAPTLSFDESHISGDTLRPGSTAQIFFNSTNLPNGVTAYYSLDNGATWRFFLDNQTTGFSWTVPDSLTTKGKIKLVAVGYPSLISIEAGNFIIAPADSVAFVRPMPNEILGADTNYMIEWAKFGVDSVKLQYAFTDGHGGFLTGIPIFANPTTDTFFKWKIPDTNSIVQLQLIPVRNEAPAATITVTIEKLIPNAVASSSAAAGLAISDIFPNPAASGEEMVLRFAEGQPKPVSVEVLDLLGRAIAVSYHVDNQAIHLDTHSLAPGAYIVRVTDGVNVVSESMEIMR